MQNLYFVVGDEYAHFSHHENVITVSDLVDKLAGTPDWQGDEKFVIGQGISTGARNHMVKALSLRGLHNKVECGEPASLHLTHKHHKGNVLITEPFRVAPKHYQMQFMFDDTADRLCDHVTGQHVGAMLLMEAARQASIAILELEHRDAFDGRHGIVVERFTTSFNSYVFPLPALMTASVEEGAVTDKNIPVICTITFYQADKEVCEMRLEGGIFSSDYLKKVEAKQGRRTVDAMRKQYQEDIAMAEVVDK